MLVLGIDFETTGFNPPADRATEIGAVLFKWNGPGDLVVLDKYNELLYSPEHPPQSDKIVQITGITNDMLEADGILFSEACEGMRNKFKSYGTIDLLMAHNAPFDKKFYIAELLLANEDYLKDVPWACSMNNIPHTASMKSRKLSHLALDYGCVVDPGTLHRAVADVLLMIEIVRKSNVDLKDLVEGFALPTVTVRAVLPKPWEDAGVGKEKAKSCGFNWDGKYWTKIIKEKDYEEEAKNLGYKLTIVG